MKLILSIISLSLLPACSPYHSYFRYTFSETKAQTIKTVIVAPLNVFIGIPKEFNKSSDRFYREIQTYLNQNGFIIKEYSDLEKKWKIKIAESPGFYNPETGKKDEKKFYQYLIEFIKDACLSCQVDAFIIPEVILREAVLAGDCSYWDGVYRKLEVGDEVVSADRYDFSGKTLALSLKVDIFNSNSEQIFHSFGGIENHLRLSFENTNKIETKEDLLMNDEFNQEAILIAFHPFIKTKIYPKKPTFSE
jgi:hypothetical protein